MLEAAATTPLGAVIDIMMPPVMFIINGLLCQLICTLTLPSQLLCLIDHAASFISSSLPGMLALWPLLLLVVVKAAVYLLTPFIIVALVYYGIIFYVESFKSFEVVLQIYRRTALEVMKKQIKNTEQVKVCDRGLLFNTLRRLAKTYFDVIMLSLAFSLCKKNMMSFHGESAGTCWITTIRALIGLTWVFYSLNLTGSKITPVNKAHCDAKSTMKAATAVCTSKANPDGEHPIQYQQQRLTAQHLNTSRALQICIEMSKLKAKSTLELIASMGGKKVEVGEEAKNHVDEVEQGGSNEEKMGVVAVVVEDEIDEQNDEAVKQQDKVVEEGDGSASDFTDMDVESDIVPGVLTPDESE